MMFMVNGFIGIFHIINCIAFKNTPKNVYNIRGKYFVSL